MHVGQRSLFITSWNNCMLNLFCLFGTSFPFLNTLVFTTLGLIDFTFLIVAILFFFSHTICAYKRKNPWYICNYFSSVETLVSYNIQVGPNKTTHFWNSVFENLFWKMYPHIHKKTENYRNDIFCTKFYFDIINTCIQISLRYLYTDYCSLKAQLKGGGAQVRELYSNSIMWRLYVFWCSCISFCINKIYMAWTTWIPNLVAFARRDVLQSNSKLL